MGKDNAGILGGLSYVHNWQQQIANTQQQELLDRQARIDAENETRLMGSQFKFGQASNKYDSGLLKEFTNTKLKEIGKFTNENPDFKTNMMKWQQFQQMTGELLNNDIVKRAARIQTHHDTLVDYIQKNPQSANNPKVQKMLAEYQNYETSGDVGGIPNGGKEFAFFNPEKISIQKPIQDAAGKLRTAKREYTKNGTLKWTADPGEVRTVAEMLFGELGYAATEELDEMRKKGYNYKDEVEMISDYMMPFTKMEEQFVPQRSGGGGGGSQRTSSPPGSLGNPMWNDITSYIQLSPSSTTAYKKGHPDAFNAFNQDKEGYINGSEVYFNGKPLNLGSKVKGSSLGEFKGQYVGEKDGVKINRGLGKFKVTIPLQDFSQLGKDELGFDPNEIIDFENWEYVGKYLTGGQANSGNIRPEYRKHFQSEVAEDGTDMVSFDVDVPFNVNDLRNQGIYNQQAHGGAEKYETGTPQFVNEMVDENNKVVARQLSDGTWLDLNGQPLK